MTPVEEFLNLLFNNLEKLEDPNIVEQMAYAKTKKDLVKHSVVLTATMKSDPMVKELLKQLSVSWN